MFHNVKAVRPLQNLNLLVDFETGEQKQYDVKPLFNVWEQFKKLESKKGLFERVRVDMGGFGIRWNNELDLACDELYYNGTAVQ